MASFLYSFGFVCVNPPMCSDLQQRLDERDELVRKKEMRLMKITQVFPIMLASEVALRLTPVSSPEK